MLISNDTSLETGDSGILVCVTANQINETITWSHNGLSVMNTPLVAVYEEVVVEGGRVFKQSFLQLCSVAIVNSGGYTCTVSNGQTVDNATIELKVSGE